MREQVTQILKNRYGIEAQAGKKAKCPFCHRKRFSIKGDDSIGKCFHPECQKVIKSPNGKGGLVSPSKELQSCNRDPVAI